MLDRRLLLRLMAATGLAASSPATILRLPHTVASDELWMRFRRPPPSANLGAYWYWLGGNVTADGITADLEAMRDAGITQPILFSIGKGDANSPIAKHADALTEYWWGLIEHAVRESDRLGLTLALNACDGWATASGPWITPEQSMQHVVWSEVTVKGEQFFSSKLPIPPHLQNYYRDLAVLALPFPEEWDQTSAKLKPTITTNLPLKVTDAQRITDPENRDEITDTEESGWVAYAFDAPFTLRSVTVHTPSPYGYSPGLYRAANSLEVQASDDGKTFHVIGRLEYPKHGWQTNLTTLTHALPETTARFFRLVHHKFPSNMPYEEEYDFGQDTRLRFFSIVLSSEPRIHHPQVKSGEQWAISRDTSAADVSAAACIKHADIRCLTAQLTADGMLNWRAPPGRWRILRIGYSTTGTTNSAAGGAQGLECDRFNADVVKLQFDKWYGEALAKVGSRYAGKVLHFIHVDSWEAGTQNWSPGFDKDFAKLRGYDILPWLPALTGIPMESAEMSERVLFDLRRTVNELTSQRFFKTIADLAHANGCQFSAEPPNPTYFADGLEYADYADLPMGEFWLNTPRNDKPNDIKDAVSGARIYGKPATGAESFTTGMMSWRETPFTMKALGDHIYCEGINRFMLHVYAQQPWLDRAPGMTLSGIGSFVSRTQTWWKPGRAWFSYLRRCQALLQAGRAVCDIAVFTGENIPARALLPRNLSQPIPAGYAYDSINRDALLRLAHVENGEIVLQSGMRYRVLLLPDVRTMTPQLADALRDLVLAGATIVGPRPERSPSLEQSSAGDDHVRAIAAELWGDLDGKNRVERQAGKGRVVWGKLLHDVLDVRPDVEMTSGGVEWTHRKGDGWDLYFLSNQTQEAVRIDAAFRVTGRAPELWHADTGSREDVAQWIPEKDRTILPLCFDPAGSLFVLFQKPSRGVDPVVAVESGDRDAILLQGRDAVVRTAGSWRLRRKSGRIDKVQQADPLAPLTVVGPWNVHFADRLKRPIVITRSDLVSWTEMKAPDLKYYAGTAIYDTTFRLPASANRHQLMLDLGDVRDLAEIRINGRDVGVLWKPPFVIDVSAFVRAGVNALEIAVSNTWNNRLVGDAGKPPSERVTTVVPLLRKGQPWLPAGDDHLILAGLLGPVVIRSLAVHKI